jgi:TetR/AcrR family transcriptional regulator, ethionamide resistance regulator
MVERAGDAPRKVSGGRRPGPSKGDLKEEAIIQTAWQLLAEQPPSSITIDQLARGAGISRPTFYFYFDSRDAVLRAVGARVAGRLQPLPMLAGDRTVASVRDVIRARALVYLDRWRLDGHLLRAMVPLYETDDELRAFWDGVLHDIAVQYIAEIEEDRATGLALPGPPSVVDLVAALFAMMWRSGYEMSLTKPSPAADRRRAEVLTTVWMRTLYGTAASG